jgi:hypothetical protein
MDLEAIEAKWDDLTFEEIAGNESWQEDPIGYCFVIEANLHAKYARATVMIDDLPRVAFSGNSVGLRRMLVDWSINRDHLAYLAYELGRAEMAIRHSVPFTQE